jgi:hypothetical protein
MYYHGHITGIGAFLPPLVGENVKVWGKPFDTSNSDMSNTYVIGETTHIASF